MTNYIILAFSVFTCISCSSASSETEIPFTERIRINQIGYYPAAPKIAVVKGTTGSEKFYVVNADLNDTVFSADLSDPRKSPYSGATTFIADFSDVSQEGDFVIVVPELGKSGPVSIKQKVHEGLAKASIKSYYFQRASSELPSQYADKWARPAGHPDTQIFVHASAVSDNRPEETVLSSSKGWYDAGDYNKYIVNSGITMGTLFSLYEDFPGYVKSMPLTIPESGNELPDLLDEALYNLRWMLTMQDPNDGGVYHKLTTAEFEGMVMPEEAINQRYVVQKSTAATLDFSAVMAQAARIFSEFEKQTPGLADSCLQASKQAWQWAFLNPDKHYDQDANNKVYQPAVRTGAYGDKNTEDELIWAAAELWATTGDEKYLEAVDLQLEKPMAVPSWPQVSALGYYTLLRHQDELQDNELVKTLKNKLINLSNSLIEETEENAYGTVMGGREGDFRWGSNAIAGNQSIALIYAYRNTGEKKYLDHALTNLDYILGRNATGYSFVTGFGYKTPMFIHHRPSEADKIDEPVPGLLAGGTNPDQQDKCDYPFDAADESYIDESCSYASNEIAINWNAPLVYLVNAIEALQYEAGYSKSK